jgi:hypothetical protein
VVFAVAAEATLVEAVAADALSAEFEAVQAAEVRVSLGGRGGKRVTVAVEARRRKQQQWFGGSKGSEKGSNTNGDGISDRRLGGDASC